MTKIAIPLDGSPFAEHVLAHLARLGSPDTIELLLIRVFETSRYYSYVAPDAVHIFDTVSWRQEANKYLKTIANSLRQQGYQVHTTVADGDVASTICDVAAAQDADLIAMTTHARSGVERWLMGSVADRVMRTATQPVYLVRPGRDVLTSGAPRRILVPLDGSTLAEAAVPQALKLVQAETELWLIQAVEVPALWGEEFISAEAVASLPTLEEQVQLARHYLEYVAATLQEQGYTVHTHVETGHPADVIAAFADAQEVDLVVMSTHGRSGLSRWVFGSVAEKVVRMVDCPILLVRASTALDPSAALLAKDPVPLV